MGEAWTPQSAAEARDAVRAALEAGQTLELTGTASRRALGRPVEADVVLDLSPISGIHTYQPEELILVAAPGTPLDEIVALLAASDQHLAFEPPDLGAVWGRPDAIGSLGGAILTGLNGPRRMSSGGARDHVLGVKGVNGFGDAFVAGGRVVKNVTGFDLSKLVAGSFGTLCAVTELTLKVLPRPEVAATFARFGLDETAAGAWMRRVINELPVAVTAAAHLPGDVACESRVSEIVRRGQSATLIRVEGFAASVAAGIEALQDAAGENGAAIALDGAQTAAAWSEIANVEFFADSDSPLWKLSVPPARGIAVGTRLAEQLAARVYYDWAGAAVWVETSVAEDAHAAALRDTLRELTAGDGCATLLRAPAEVRSRVAPFEPLARAVAELNERVRRRFDPEGIFNPGRTLAPA